MSLDIPFSVPSGINSPVDMDARFYAWFQDVKESGPKIGRKVALGVALFSLLGSMMATSACGGGVTHPQVVEPTATHQSVCTILGPAPEGVVGYEPRYLPIVGDSDYVPVKGVYLVDATASTNEERFDTMVRDLNSAFSGLLRGYPYFNITQEGLQRLSHNDFPFIFPGGEVSVIDDGIVFSIVRFLECAQVEDGVPYIIRDENYKPPVPYQEEEGIWKLLEDIFPSPLGSASFAIPLIGGVIGKRRKKVGGKPGYTRRANKISPFHHPRAYRP